VRDDLLNIEEFGSLEAQVVVEAGRVKYNRPHSALGGLISTEYAEQVDHQRARTLIGAGPLNGRPVPAAKARAANAVDMRTLTRPRFSVWTRPA
jgi:hypothetical protein